MLPGSRPNVVLLNSADPHATDIGPIDPATVRQVGEPFSPQVMRGKVRAEQRHLRKLQA